MLARLDGHFVAAIEENFAFGLSKDAGAILLVASFGTYTIISTITHEKARDIAIMKSLGMREYAVRRIFIIEAAIIAELEGLTEEEAAGMLE